MLSALLLLMYFFLHSLIELTYSIPRKNGCVPKAKFSKTLADIQMFYLVDIPQGNMVGVLASLTKWLLFCQDNGHVVTRGQILQGTGPYAMTLFGRCSTRKHGWCSSKPDRVIVIPPGQEHFVAQAQILQDSSPLKTNNLVGVLMVK